MRLHIFKSVERFPIEQHRIKREALASIRAKLRESVNAKRQSETFPQWMECEAKHV